MKYEKKRIKNSVVRVLLIILGLISLGMGVLGIFLPLLPTTPFMLLSAFLFIRSSDKLYQWLINHRLFGKYIHDYLEKRTIPRRVKWFTLALLWITIIMTITTLQLKEPGRGLLLLIAAGVTFHVLKLRNS
jgi:uncharacterized membrane protein YbaN (DUF454 family)